MFCFNFRKGYLLKILNFFLLFTLIIITIFCLIALHVIYKKYAIQKNNIEYLLIEKRNIDENFCLQLKTSNNYIDENVQLYDETGNRIKFKEISSDNPKLLLRYTINMCGSCADYVFDLLKETEKEIGPDNIVILSSFDNYIPLKAFKISNNFNFKVYNVTEPLIEYPLEQLKIPALMIIINNKIESILVLDWKYHNANIKYLSIIKKKYFG